MNWKKQSIRKRMEVYRMYDMYLKMGLEAPSPETVGLRMGQVRKFINIK